jgi:hypothetical protein
MPFNVIGLPLRLSENEDVYLTAEQIEIIRDKLDLR